MADASVDGRRSAPQVPTVDDGELSGPVVVSAPSTVGRALTCIAFAFHFCSTATLQSSTAVTRLEPRSGLHASIASTDMILLLSLTTQQQRSQTTPQRQYPPPYVPHSHRKSQASSNVTMETSSIRHSVPRHRQLGTHGEERERSSRCSCYHTRGRHREEGGSSAGDRATNVSRGQRLNENKRGRRQTVTVRVASATKISPHLDRRLRRLARPGRHPRQSNRQNCISIVPGRCLFRPSSSPPSPPRSLTDRSADAVGEGGTEGGDSAEAGQGGLPMAHGHHSGGGAELLCTLSCPHSSPSRAATALLPLTAPPPHLLTHTHFPSLHSTPPSPCASRDRRRARKEGEQCSASQRPPLPPPL